MNRQEILKKIEEKKNELAVNQGLYSPMSEMFSRFEVQLIAYAKCENYVQQLDEPQKPVVPQFVAEKMKLYKSAFEMLAAEYFDLSSEIDSDDLANWIDQNGEKFLRAWLDGYEVVKEPEYHVILSENTGGWKYTFLDGEGSIDRTNNKAHIPTFTEKKVKAIDERYWPFAVPVEEVAER